MNKRIYILLILSILFQLHSLSVNAQIFKVENYDKIRITQKNFFNNEYKEVLAYYDSINHTSTFISMETYKYAYISCQKLKEEGFKTEYMNYKASEILKASEFWFGSNQFNEKWKSLKLLDITTNMETSEMEVPEGLRKYIKKIHNQANYPNQARRMNIKGVVYVHIIFNKDGSHDAVLPLNGLGAGCDEEAARVVNEIPNFGPVKQNGKAIYHRMVVQVKF